MSVKSRFDVARIVRSYSFTARVRAGKTSAAKKLVRKSYRPAHILLLGFGGTISSGYTPTQETIVPLRPSPAIKQVEYMNLFGTSNIKHDRLDLLAKDSREIVDSDIEDLIDILNLVPNEKVLITAGTYMLPKIAEAVARTCVDLRKSIVLTGSILPAGFLASDADANIWSALTLLNYLSQKGGSGGVHVAFHGRVFSTAAEFAKLNLHSKQIEDMVIQYPLSSVPVDGVL